jgi:glycerate kinase
MRVLVIPDSFTGTLSAPEAAIAIQTGWQQGAPNDEVMALAISDGGPGFISALLTSAKYRSHEITVSDLLNREVKITLASAQLDKLTFFIESAQIVGSHLVAAESQRRPADYTSYGIGEAIKFALSAGAARIVIGLGGTASIDGGAGLLAALGAQPAELLSRGGGALAGLNNLKLDALTPAIANVELIVAADVDVPLLGSRGAAFGFGAQKGASAELQAELEVALTNFSNLIPIRPDGKNAALMMGAGAAGGIGYAILALGGSKVAGFDYVAAALDLPAAIEKADLVVTGEGKFDWQSLQGKAISQLAKLCLSTGKPLLVLAGQVDVGRREWSAVGIVGTYGCSDDGEIPTNPATTLSQLAVRVSRTFSPTSWQN